ncbi:MAG: SRPBCC domain-containing protein [Balneolaceae bacterium]|nr:SRPBCC domain-containing protein [Balneolaceae bacterium]MBO6546646.1 SRPBCC domain-containing protein [Balneolaceae bacterium]MBO6649004.1 SRPBCC domain-containing protein [Balneolaceae bacterium]
MVSFEISAFFPVSSEELYSAWLDSEQHSAITGGKAICSKKEGEAFTAWDGYITGINQKLVKGKEIIQSWRTSDFNDSDSHSLLTLKFSKTDNGCELTLIHSEIPEGQPDYEQGWEQHYFEPMKEYFSK